MEKEFIPYEEALALKELGFDEPCFGLFHNDKSFYPTQCKSHEDFYGQICSAPLYQQAFRWFREKYQLHPEIIVQLGFAHWNAHILPGSEWLQKPTPTGFETYEEVELACLRK